MAIRGTVWQGPFKLLAGIGATGAGNWYLWEVRGYRNFLFFAGDTGKSSSAAATFVFETVLDNSVGFVNPKDQSVLPTATSVYLAAPFATMTINTGSGVVGSQLPLMILRANCTAYTSGTWDVLAFAAP